METAQEHNDFELTSFVNELLQIGECFPKLSHPTFSSVTVCDFTVTWLTLWHPFPGLTVSQPSRSS